MDQTQAVKTMLEQRDRLVELARDAGEREAERWFNALPNYRAVVRCQRLSEKESSDDALLCEYGEQRLQELVDQGTLVDSPSIVSAFREAWIAHVAELADAADI